MAARRISNFSLAFRILKSYPLGDWRKAELPSDIGIAIDAGN